MKKQKNIINFHSILDKSGKILSFNISNYLTKLIFLCLTFFFVWTFDSKSSVMQLEADSLIVANNACINYLYTSNPNSKKIKIINLQYDKFYIDEITSSANISFTKISDSEFEFETSPDILQLKITICGRVLAANDKQYKLEIVEVDEIDNKFLFDSTFFNYEIYSISGKIPYVRLSKIVQINNNVIFGDAYFDIEYFHDQNSLLSFTLYNLIGQEIKSVKFETIIKGLNKYRFVYDGVLSPGIYLIVMRSDAGDDFSKIVRMR